MTPKEALDLSFECDDLRCTLTIRDYMKALLKKLFEETECFSGKRPFGNSGWDWDIARPLVAAGAITGTIDEHNSLNLDDGEFNVFVAQMIDAL